MTGNEEKRTGTGEIDEIDPAMSDEIEELFDASVTSTKKIRPPLGRSGRLLWAVALVPALALLLLLSMVVRVRLADGAWPSYNNPDPKELGLHYTISIVAFLGAFVAAVMAPILALVAFLRGHRSVTIAPLAVAGIGFVVYLLVLRLDVGGLGAWFAD